MTQLRRNRSLQSILSACTMLIAHYCALPTAACAKVCTQGYHGSQPAVRARVCHFTEGTLSTAELTPFCTCVPSPRMTSLVSMFAFLLTRASLGATHARKSPSKSKLSLLFDDCTMQQHVTLQYTLGFGGKQGGCYPGIGVLYKTYLLNRAWLLSLEALSCIVLPHMAIIPYSRHAVSLQALGFAHPSAAAVQFTEQSVSHDAAIMVVHLDRC